MTSRDKAEQYAAVMRGMSPPAEEKEAIPIANSIDAPGLCGDDDKQLWILRFGAYAETQVLVWADGIEEAFEEAVEWLDDNAPGHLVSIGEAELQEAADELGLELPPPEERDWDDPDFSKIVEAAESDLTQIGHTTLKNGQYVTSYEWFVDEADDETRKEAIERSLAEHPDF